MPRKKKDERFTVQQRGEHQHVVLDTKAAPGGTWTVHSEHRTEATAKLVARGLNAQALEAEDARGSDG